MGEGGKVQIYFLLTENCNLNCSMCVRGKQSGVNLNFDKLNMVVKENDFSEHDIVLTGGEPTLHKQFLEIIDLMCKVSKTVVVTTNGTRNEFLEKLGAYKNLSFQISIDGDLDTHNQIRGKGAFEKSWKTIKLLDTLGLQYTVASVVSRKNVSEIVQLLPKLEKLNYLKYWSISYEMPFGNASLENIMSAQEWNDFVNHILKIAKLRVKIKKLFPFELYDKYKNDLENKFELLSMHSNCGSGKNKIYVYPNLKVYPCTCLTDFCIGDLSKETLCEIIEGNKILPFAKYGTDKDSECKNCEYLNFCNGGCMGMSYHYMGKLGMGDKRCPKLL